MKRILFGVIALFAGLLLTAPASANNCLSFDGIDDYIDCTNDYSLQMSDNVTVEAWILTTSSNRYQGIASKLVHEGDREGYSLEIWEDNKLHFSLGCNWSDWSQAESSIPLSTGTWYHVAGTYDGNTIRVYLNGELQGATTYTSGIMDSQTPLVIGSRYGDWFFSGKIDLVRIWNYARSQEQIQASKSLIVASGTTGLVAQYTFDQGVDGGENSAITTLDDCSGGQGKSSPVDGTLSGFDLTGPSSNWVASSAPEAVEMVDFTAIGQSGLVQLAWSTASETNSFQWLVERSMAAEKGFVRIGMLQASGSSCGQAYQFADNAVQPGQTYYYRIAEQDINGKLTWFGPVSASIKSPASTFSSVKFGPNPFRDATNIAYTVTGIVPVVCSVAIYNTIGQHVRTLQQGATSPGAHCASWNGADRTGSAVPQGVYFARIAIGGTIATHKLIKIK